MKPLIINLNDEIAVTNIVNAVVPLSPIVNTSTATWDGNPTTGISGTASITVLPPATLTITKTANPTVVISGIKTPVIFTITLTNTSTTTLASNVVITDTIPDGLTITGVASTAGTVAWTSPNNKFTVTVATLAPNAFVTVTVTTNFIN